MGKSATVDGASGRRRLSVWVMCALSLAALFICVRIEILNALAGYYLPRELPTEGNPKWRRGIDNEKGWRLLCYRPMSVAEPEMPLERIWPLALEDKQLLRGVLDAHANEFSAEERATLDTALSTGTELSGEDYWVLRRLISLVPMSSEEQATMQREVSRARKYNRLHGAVETTGLLQYLLAPVAWLFALVMLFNPPNRRDLTLTILCLVGASASIALMLYRDYFWSLGW